MDREPTATGKASAEGEPLLDLSPIDYTIQADYLEAIAASISRDNRKVSVEEVQDMARSLQESFEKFLEQHPYEKSCPEEWNFSADQWTSYLLGLCKQRWNRFLKGELQMVKYIFNGLNQDLRDEKARREREAEDTARAAEAAKAAESTTAEPPEEVTEVPVSIGRRILRALDPRNWLS